MKRVRQVKRVKRVKTLTLEALGRELQERGNAFEDLAWTPTSVGEP